MEHRYTQYMALELSNDHLVQKVWREKEVIVQEFEAVYCTLLSETFRKLFKYCVMMNPDAIRKSLKVKRPLYKN